MDKVIFLKQGDGGAVLRQVNRYTLIFFDAMLDAAEHFNRDYTITEGWRPGTGLHPKDIAWDVRAKDMDQAHRKELNEFLRSNLPVYFDVVLEQFPLDPGRDHFHVEMDPKKLLTFLHEMKGMNN